MAPSIAIENKDRIYCQIEWDELDEGVWTSPVDVLRHQFP